ncbi:3-hydroxyacyl-CoA dehydrogenase [Aromatoleum bremense]|uniref:SDR family NAD(P)-dependent oxidoreductase n=1 Tax=Aromatoleum bremense TaxID=76115 RepID=A0ABX1NYA6_9RHOO|nr:3-hydroxyacyl-CoA dehydrogenase [Aromatoleum bremense]NMG17034.1 SDR family NAD(P)-dependent oxidoreductase [Aromatoleum bremense]QTQ34181.1 Putative 3-hydroxyacyl-CoA dehydrogenase [Aromatoleum bremense]
MKFENSTFIITGGASGLGEATARAFHAAGANVVIADLNTAAGEKLADEFGSRAAFHRTDVAFEADARGCVEVALKRFGTLNGLVSCAGIGTAAKVLGKDGPHPLDVFSRIVNVNLVGTFNMIRIASEAMSKGEANAGGERGVIINTASVAAYDGQIGQAGYAASKGGIVSMTLPIARELARFGIRVVTIAPGLFLTPMMQGLPPDVQKTLGETVPFPPRLGEPAEYAQLARQIVENVMLNGETIRLDGAIRLAPR